MRGRSFYTTLRTYEVTIFCQSPEEINAVKWRKRTRYYWTYRGASRGRVQGGRTPPPEMTCGFLINTVQSASQLYKICFIIWYVFSAVHIMLLPSRKPSSSYSLLKFVYVTSQLRHSLVVHPLLRKILDPPLTYLTGCLNCRFCRIFPWPLSCCP